MPFKLGPLELVLILVIVFVIFGAGKLPQIFESLGKGISSLRKKQDGEAADETAKGQKAVKKTTRKSAKT